jgi:hypothetical protein
MKKLVVLLTAALALAIGTGTAAARGNPNGVLATPAEVCSVLTNPSAVLGLVLYDSDFATCMRNLHADMAAYRFASDITGEPISLDQRCTELEQFFGVGYPFVFDEGEGWPIVTLSAMNHQQCEYTLWTYHYVFEQLGPPPES